MQTLYGNYNAQNIQDLLFERIKEITLRRPVVTVVDCFDTFHYSKKARAAP